MSESCNRCGKNLRGGPRYPFDDLRLSHNESARTLGISGRTWQNYMCHGVGRDAAERIADRMGVHVYELWPEMVADDADVRPCTDCGEPFVPSRRGHKLYCSTRCCDRAASRRRMRRIRATEQGRAENRRRSREYKAYLRERQAS